jgi:hypothetical protein
MGWDYKLFIFVIWRTIFKSVTYLGYRFRDEAIIKVPIWREILRFMLPTPYINYMFYRSVNQ